METSWFLLKLLCASCSCARMNPRHSQPGCCTAQDRSRARPPRPRRRRRRTQLGLRPVAQGPHPSPTPRRPANGRAVEPTRRTCSLASGRQQGQGLCPAEWCRCGAACMANTSSYVACSAAELQPSSGEGPAQPSPPAPRKWDAGPAPHTIAHGALPKKLARGPPNPHPQHPSNRTPGPRRAPKMAHGALAKRSTKTCMRSTRAQQSPAGTVIH